MLKLNWLAANHLKQQSPTNLHRSRNFSEDQAFPGELVYQQRETWGLRRPREILGLHLYGKHQVSSNTEDSTEYVPARDVLSPNHCGLFEYIA